MNEVKPTHKNKINNNSFMNGMTSTDTNKKLIVRPSTT